MTAMWTEGFKQVRDADGSTLSWGQALGAYGFTVERRTDEAQGAHYTELSLRRVKPAGNAEEELQMSVELTQRYNSGANSRHMYGCITLRGRALEEFCRRVVERADTLAELRTVERKAPKRVE